ncbi:hypothetical protein QJS66_02390 [Kocuria rhizophila]|nr:hypothetical protein QJS66_02390 [Kocuria rhizophila]
MTRSAGGPSVTPPRRSPALERFHLNLTATRRVRARGAHVREPGVCAAHDYARRWPRRGGVVIWQGGQEQRQAIWSAAMRGHLGPPQRRALAGGEAPEDDFVPFRSGAPVAPGVRERGRLAACARSRQRLASMQ